MNIITLTDYFPILVLLMCIFGFGGYYYLRKLKGSIEIKIPGTIFSSDETLSGSFHLKTNKVVQGNRLFVKFYGIGRTGKYETEVYNKELEIEGTRSYSRNYSNFYNFNFDVPTLSQIGEENSRREFTWIIEVRLDCDGVDLSKLKEVKVNLK